MADRPEIRHLPGAEARDGEVFHSEGGELKRLDLAGVVLVVAAEVGEPEGIRTVVFDLFLEGPAPRLLRLDADPMEGALPLARALAAAVGKEHCAPSLLSYATDAIASQSFPDLESYENAVLSGEVGLWA